MQNWTINAIVAIVWAIVPMLAFGFAGEEIARWLSKLSLPVRLILPAVVGIPYLLASSQAIRASWVALYLGLPIVIAILLWRARLVDPEQKGNWRDFVILLLLGLAVDLRWLEPAWPTQLRFISKLILLDSGLYGFLVVRQLSNVGFDLRFRLIDLRIGLRELLFYAPIVVPLGLWLSFLHFRLHTPDLGRACMTVLFTFFGIAVPEEIYFRGWIQNLMERRVGRNGALLTTAILFGLAHFNRLSTHFNWRYVLLASIAGIFYGRAWRENQRIAASAITHSLVDAIWVLWL